MSSHDSVKIAFYGDSITDGYPGVSYFKRLQQRLPGYTLLNFGRFNDTAISLHRRIITRRLLRPVDAAFVWVGVNDVIVRQSRIFSRVRRWWARDNEEFRIHYRALLDLLTPHAGLIVTVSPALLGEDPTSPANATLTAFGEIMSDLTADCPNARYLDLHARFMQVLENDSGTAYQSPHLLQSVFDALTLRTPEAVDRVGAERGLRLTLDNVHLNSKGAALAADAFESVITGIRTP